MGHLLLSPSPVRVALREGAVVEPLGEAVGVTVGSVRLRLSSAAAGTLRQLANGGLDAGKAERSPVVAALRRHAFLDRVVELGDGGSIRCQPLLPGFELRSSPVAPGAVAGAHAFARFDSGALVVEDVSAGIRVIAAGAAAAAAAAVLAGTDGGDLGGAVAQELWSAHLLEQAGDGRADVWEWHDLLLHARSRMGRSDAPYGATWRLRGRIPVPPALIDTRGAVVPLPAPDPAPRRDFFDVLERRRSRREFGERPVTLAELGSLFHHAARVRAVHDGEWPTTERPYPSGGAAYELELYLAVSRCEGLAPGLYRHLPERHALERREADPRDVEQLLVDAGRAAAADPPPLLVVCAARFARVAYKYESIAYALVLKHVGVVQQTLCLTAEALGLAACPLGGGNAETFARAAGVDPLSEPSVGELALGSLPLTSTSGGVP